MNNKFLKRAVGLAAMFALAACSNETEVMNDGAVAAQISAGVASSRANGAIWEADEIGIMVTDAADMQNLYRNVGYKTSVTTTGSATFAPIAGGIFFQNAAETVTFAAYGPYKATSDVKDLPGSSGVISLTTNDQSDRTKQKAFDFIYASGVTASLSSPTVQFSGERQFTHKMTRLVIVVRTSADHGFTAEKVTEGIYCLSGLQHTGQFDVTTGEALATGTPSDDWSLSSNGLKTDGETTQCTFTVILYPQTLSKALTLTAAFSGLPTYSNSTAIKPELQAGKSYEYTITVKQTGLDISNCTITAWGNGSAGSGTVEI